jgi:hypothetical protein
MNQNNIAIAAVLGTSLLAGIFANTTGAQLQTAFAQNLGNGNFRGSSLEQWGDSWWQFFFALDTSVTGNPFTDTTGALCDIGLQGNMLFLVGTTTGLVQPEPRTCMVKPGTSILIPLVNVVCNTLEAPPFFGATEPEQRACSQGIMEQVDPSSLVATVDGVSVQPIRVQSPPGGFQFTAAPNNPFATPPGVGTGVADGHWLLLHPLPPGEHIITVGASIPNFGFETGVTYNIIVQPGLR